MEAMNKLSSHLKTRLVDLRKAKEEVRKIVGYTPGGGICMMMVEVVLRQFLIAVEAVQFFHVHHLLSELILGKKKGSGILGFTDPFSYLTC